MKTYEKPTAAVLPVVVSDILLVSTGNLADGGEGAELASLRSFAWNE